MVPNPAKSVRKMLAFSKTSSTKKLNTGASSLTTSATENYNKNASPGNPDSNEVQTFKKSVSLPPQRPAGSNNSLESVFSKIQKENYTLVFTEQKLGMQLRALPSGNLSVAGYRDFVLNSNTSKRKPKVDALLVGMEDIKFKGMDPKEVMQNLRNAGRPLKLHFIEPVLKAKTETASETKPALWNLDPRSVSSVTITVTGRVGMWARLMGTFRKVESRQVGGKPVYWKGNAASGHFLYCTENSGRWGITDREENMESGTAGIGSIRASDSPTDDRLTYKYFMQGKFIDDHNIRVFEGTLESPKIVTLHGGSEALSLYMGCYEKVDDMLINGRPVYKKEMSESAQWLTNCPSTGTWVIHDNELNITSRKYQPPRIQSNVCSLLPHDADLLYQVVGIKGGDDKSMTIVEGDPNTSETLKVTSSIVDKGSLNDLMGEYHRIDEKYMNGFPLFKLTANLGENDVDAYLFRTSDTGRWGIATSDENMRANKCSIRAISSFNEPTGKDQNYEVVNDADFSCYTANSNIKILQIQKRHEKMPVKIGGASLRWGLLTLVFILIALGISAAVYDYHLREVLDGLLKIKQ